MKLISLFFVVFPTLFIQLGCSGPASSPDANVVKVQNDENVFPNADVSTQFASAAEALAEGNRLFEGGETVKAISALLEAVKLDPDLAEAYFKLGIAYSLIEAQDNSVKETAEVPNPKGNDSKEVKPNSEKAFRNAVNAYKKTLSANKSDDTAHFNLGLAYNKLNEDEDAAKSLREAIRLKPDDTQYQTELGSILIKLAKYHEAVGALKKAIELDATNVKAEELLEKAEAGRLRIDYTPVKKDDKKLSNSNTNVTNESTVPAANSTSKDPGLKRPGPPITAKSPN